MAVELVQLKERVIKRAKHTFDGKKDHGSNGGHDPLLEGEMGYSTPRPDSPLQSQGSMHDLASNGAEVPLVQRGDFLDDPKFHQVGESKKEVLPVWQGYFGGKMREINLVVTTQEFEKKGLLRRKHATVVQRDTQVITNPHISDTSQAPAKQEWVFGGGQFNHHSFGEAGPGDERMSELDLIRRRLAREGAGQKNPLLEAKLRLNLPKNQQTPPSEPVSEPQGAKEPAKPAQRPVQRLHRQHEPTEPPENQGGNGRTDNRIPRQPKAKPIPQREEAAIDLVGMSIREFLADLEDRGNRGIPFDENQEWNIFLRENPEAVGMAKDFPEVMTQWQRIVDEAEKYREESGENQQGTSRQNGSDPGESRIDQEKSAEKPLRKPSQPKKETSEGAEAERSREDVERAYLAFHTLAWEDVVQLLKEAGFKAREIEKIRKTNDPESLVRAVKKQRNPLLGDETRDLFLSLPNEVFSLVVEHLERQRYIALKDGSFNEVAGYKSSKLPEPIGTRSLLREGPPLGAHFQHKINEEWERLTGKGEWTEEEKTLLASAELLRSATRKLIDTFPKKTRDLFLAQATEIDRERWEKWFPGRERPHPEADSKRRVEQREELVLPRKQSIVQPKAPETASGEDKEPVSDALDASEGSTIASKAQELPQDIAQQRDSRLPDELSWVEDMLQKFEADVKENGLQNFSEISKAIFIRTEGIPDPKLRKLAQERVDNMTQSLYGGLVNEANLQNGEVVESAAGDRVHEWSIFDSDDKASDSDAYDWLSDGADGASTSLPDENDRPLSIVRAFPPPILGDPTLDHDSSVSLGDQEVESGQSPIFEELDPGKFSRVEGAVVSVGGEVLHHGREVVDQALHTVGAMVHPVEEAALKVARAGIEKVKHAASGESEPTEIHLDYGRGKSVIPQLREAIASNTAEQQYVRANEEQLKALVLSLPLPKEKKIWKFLVRDPQITNIILRIDQGTLKAITDVNFRQALKSKNAHIEVTLGNNSRGGFTYVKEPEISGFVGAGEAQDNIREHSEDFVRDFLAEELNKQLVGVGEIMGFVIENETVKVGFKKAS